MKINDIQSTDTIAAVATAQGVGAIAIVRMSGDDVKDIMGRIFHGRPLEDHQMVYGKIVRNGEIADEVMACYMQSPRSYTGEDTVEIYCHGSIVTTRAVLQAALEQGARMAQPGEFTKRAFLNGKLDLSQAEAVADVINATTQSAVDTALNQLSGRLKQSVNQIMDVLVKQIAHIEVTVDYPQEDIEEQTAQAALHAVENALEKINHALQQADRGRIYRNGIRCAIIGQPNVGKSSLLNALLGEARAIVTPVAGTTRDTLEAHVDMGGIEVIIHDTAGIRDSGDDVERIGIQRAYGAAENAQLILMVIDSAKPVDDLDVKLYQDIRHKPHVIILSKGDLDALTTAADVSQRLGEAPVILTSANEGAGIRQLEQSIVHLIEGEDGLLPRETELSNVRHIDAMNRARAALAMAQDTLASGQPVDLAVVDLRNALDILGEITGDSVDEQIIDSIFRDFCLGK